MGAVSGRRHRQPPSASVCLPQSFVTSCTGIAAMARNIILLISTVAVLVLMFVGYQAWIEPARPPEDAAAANQALPGAMNVAPEKQISIKDVNITPGRQMGYVNYDPLTGEPTEYLRLDTWEKVPGTQDELLLTRPELMMRLPSGMVLTIAADRGQVKADSIRKRRIEPKRGWLEGHVRIVLDRETSYQRAPLGERPEDRVAIETDRIEFDMNLGEVKTDRPLRVTSEDFEVTGTGLQLIWNREDNRIEKLEIASGGTMTLRGDMLASLGATPEPAAGDAPVPVTRPSAGPGAAEPAAPASGGRRRRSATYRCVLTGGVRVDQFVGAQRRGSLRGDRLALLIDMARGGVPGSRRAAASAPAAGRGRAWKTAAPGEATTARTPGPGSSGVSASAPTTAPTRRVVVTWGARLSLLPAAAPRRPGEPRRRVEATGSPLVLEAPNGRVRCGRLALHEEARRLWLYPPAGGGVDLVSGDRLSVRAASIFVDLDARIIKLIGDVALSSGVSDTTGPLDIRCSAWGELHLAQAPGAAPPGVDVFDNPLASSPPESATFVGDVEVRLGEQVLRAHRLDTRFRQPAPAPRAGAATAAGATQPGARGGAATLQGLLDAAIATGDVELVVSEPSKGPAWIRVLRRQARTIRRAATRALVPRGPSGADPVERSLRCARLELDFATTPGRVHVRHMRATGAVNLRDRRSHFAARGREIDADFVEQNDLGRATIRGAQRVPARVLARGYRLRGNVIHVDNQARTLRVDGRSTLAFLSRRGLQGLANLRDQWITVTSARHMAVDERNNRVEFAGDVVAGTRTEKLHADTLALTLAPASDAPPPSVLDRATLVVDVFRGRLPRGDANLSASRAMWIKPRGGSGRKDLDHIRAVNAVIESRLLASGGGQPIVERSLSAPELEIDVRRRIIHTTGHTVLGMTNRRGAAGKAGARPMLGVSSALVSTGPSITAMSCDSGLIYALGKDGPQRRDTVLFRDKVQFQHVAVTRAADLEPTLRRIIEHGGPLHNIPGRHTIVTCDRLEVAFEVTAGAASSLGTAKMQLTWLNATGNVRLRDQQGADVRTIYAHQLEYDAKDKLAWVLGDPQRGIMARIFDENLETHRLNRPAVGPKFILNLQTRTIETGAVRGRVGG